VESPDRRKLYFKAKRSHKNKLSSDYAKANDYRSLRTYRSQLDADVPEITQRFLFYLRLSGIEEFYNVRGKYTLPRGKKGLHHYLEKIAREKLGLTISNYTIDGFIRSERFGTRSNPKPQTKKEIKILTIFLENLCKRVGTWQQFKFKYHKSELRGGQNRTKK